MTKTDDNIYTTIQDELKGELVFDIGANQGLITKLLLDIPAKVIAVEPQQAKLNLPVFNDVQAKLAVCISDHDGEVDFHECVNYNTISTCYSEWKDGYFKQTSKWHPPKKKKALTLDTLINTYGKPKYIKVDVEGYEDKVLAGLSAPIDLLSFEYTGGYDKVFSQCMQHIKRLGAKSITSFQKIKTKTKRGDQIVKRTHFEVQVFESVEECLTFFASLDRYKQGDILVRF